MDLPPAPIPYGSTLLHQHCMAFYPNQQTPLQIKAVKSFIQGGPDPLDFVNIYSNKGDGKSISRHWHYVSFGLTDLYGLGNLSSYLGFSYP